jgi:hypothetical protein
MQKLPVFIAFREMEPNRAKKRINGIMPDNSIIAIDFK